MISQLEKVGESGIGEVGGVAGMELGRMRS